MLTGLSVFGLKSKEPRLRDWNTDNRYLDIADDAAWNQKNLDYEIETTDRQQSLNSERSLEIKRTSITRLKQEYPIIFLSYQRIIGTWNQKNLDSEIETMRTLILNYIGFGTWNQKNLDSEIETRHL